MARLGAKDFLSLTAEERRALPPFKKKDFVTGCYKNFTRQELLDFLIKNDIKTVTKLKEVAKREDPTLNFYIEEFGKWSEAIFLAFGIKTGRVFVPKVEYVPKIDMARYLVRCVLERKLWTWGSYEEAQKQFPKIIPNQYSIKKEFGTFTKLLYAARAECLKETLHKYRVLIRKLGFVPTELQCRGYGLDISEAVVHFAGKYALDRFVKQIDKQEKKLKKQPNSEQTSPLQEIKSDEKPIGNTTES